MTLKHSHFVALSQPMPVDLAREVTRALIEFTRRRQGDSYWPIHDSKGGYAHRHNLPPTSALRCILDQVDVSKEYFRYSDDLFNSVRELVSALTGDGTPAAILSIEIDDVGIDRDLRAHSYLTAYCGYRQATGIEFGLSLGNTSPAASDPEYREALYLQIFDAMGIAEQIAIVREEEGARLRSTGELKVREMSSTLDGTLTGRFVVFPFPSFNDVCQRVEAVLELPTVRQVRNLRMFVEMSQERYEAWRQRLNAFAEDWTLGWVGRLREGVDPFAEPVSLPATAPPWLPLVCWCQYRTIDGRRAEFDVLCSLLRTAHGVRLEICSDNDDVDRVLRDAEKGTGLKFEVMSKQEMDEIERDWDER